MFRLNFDFAAMRFDDIITQTEPESGSLTRGLCCEEGLKYFIHNGLRYPITVIAHGDGYLMG